MKRGDIVQLGRHRLMCGDATDQVDVQWLFDDRKADIVFTSPPYLNKRIYGSGLNGRDNWTELMAQAMAFPNSDACQVFVNLGHCHKNNEWHEYWRDWLEVMRARGWRRFGQYIWDTGYPLPGHARGRLLPQYEFVFHLNRTTLCPKKILPTLCGGRLINGAPIRLANKPKKHMDWHGRAISMTKPHANIVRVTRCNIKGNIHPARFPPELPKVFFLSYANAGMVAYDPFGGSGSSIVAAEESEVSCLFMEIEQVYCEMSIERYRKHVEAKTRAAKKDNKINAAIEVCR